ncbi:uncharacterized protein pclob isoform X7 [Denticeps clupeoides]|uniref:uncharacterized protein pclob isoform X7 n=1 Tax=Denticeps clupeoides TaxID=299321 RepID=UPI0010A57370|nr:uncharacterized protein LOC114767050 isoform X7 [Denticeps clupeoides]
MFSSNFLSGANPLSAVSSAVNKFGLFGEEGEGGQNKQQQGNGQPAPPKPAGLARTGAQAQQGPSRGVSPQPGAAPGPSKAGPQAKSAKSLCPVCKSTELNLKSKEPSNYNTCTQCRSQVCSLCGFSPPDSEGKEWLCLNCQMQRALGEAGPKTKAPPPTSHPAKKGAPASGPAQTAQPQQQMPKGGTPPAKSAPHQQQGQPPKQESGLFGFGLGGLRDAARSRSPSPQPAESVSGKVLGFGSSIFSSASNLITSAAQEEAPVAPPTARKESASAQASPKPEEKQPGQVGPGEAGRARQSQASPAPARKAEASAGPQKKPGVSKAGPPSCPLCSLQLNVGSGEPPNYSICTECKNTVCDRCGFNPMPHLTEVKSWLCLNCQMKQALGGIDHPGPMMKPQLQSKKSPQPIKRNNPPPSSPQKKLAAQAVAEQEIKTSIQHAPPAQQRTEPTHLQQQVQGKPQKTDAKASPAKPVPPTQVEAPKQDSSFFGLSFGGAKDMARSPSPSPQPSGLVSGKVLGFGSSIFSQASSFISSAIQDEASAGHKDSVSNQDSSKAPSKIGDKQSAEQTPEESKLKERGPEKMTGHTKSGLKEAAESKKVKQMIKSELQSEDVSPVTLGATVGPVDHLVTSPVQKDLQTEAKNTEGQKKTDHPTIRQTNAKLSTDQKSRQGQVYQNTQKPSSKADTSSLEPEQGPATETLKQESSFFGFGFMGAKDRSRSQSPSSKPADTDSGKVFSFGSSIFSTASNLIGSVVPNEVSKATEAETHAGLSKRSSNSQIQTQETSLQDSSQVKDATKANLHSSVQPNKKAGSSQKTTPGEQKPAASAKAKDQTSTTDLAHSAATPPNNQRAESEPLHQRASGQPDLQRAKADACPAKPDPQPQPVPHKQESKEASRPQPHTASVSGKVLGFGSSLFSSASNLITSNQDPISSSPQVTAQTGLEPTNILSKTVSEETRAAYTSKTAENLEENFICENKLEPVKQQAKLNVKTEELHKVKATSNPKRSDDSSNQQSKEANLQKKDSPQQKLKATPPVESTTTNPAEPTQPVPLRKTSGQKQTEHFQDVKSSPAKPTQNDPVKQESSFFGFGIGSVSRPRSPSPQPAGSVSDKVLGIGSSIFSSASNFISSAVQDDPNVAQSTGLKRSEKLESSKIPTDIRQKLAKEQPKKEYVQKEITTEAMKVERKKQDVKLEDSRNVPQSTATLISTTIVHDEIPRSSLEKDESHKISPQHGQNQKAKDQPKDKQPKSVPHKSSHQMQQGELPVKCEAQQEMEESTKKESSHFGFGFGITKGVSKTQSALPQAAGPVPGKVLDFGTSIFNSASTFIASTVQDELLEVQKVAADTKQESSNIEKQTDVTRKPVQRNNEGLKLEDTSEKTEAEKSRGVMGINAISSTEGVSSQPQKTAAPSSQIIQKDVNESKETKQSEPPLASSKTAPGRHASSKSAFAKPSTQDLPGKKAGQQTLPGELSQQIQKGNVSPARNVQPRSEPPKQESSFFGFSFGGVKDASRSQSLSSQPGASVSGKVLGFGSSILSSASGFITPSSQDEPSASKASPKKGIAQKQDATLGVKKADGNKQGVQKEEVSKKGTFETRVGNTVEIKNRELEKNDPRESAMVTMVKSENKNLKDVKHPEIKQLAEDSRKDIGSSGSLPSKSCPAPTLALQKDQDIKKFGKDQVGPSGAKEPSGVKPKQESVQQTSGEKVVKMQQPRQENTVRSTSQPQTEHNKQESSFFGFGFGAAKETLKSQAPAPKSSESVSGKVFGFGSSILSSATNLMSSAVQDEASTKSHPSIQQSLMKPLAAENRTQKNEERELEQHQVPRQTDPLRSAKTSCPMCKMDLNVGSQEAPNFSTCTSCKTIVCNRCGFNPMPHITEAKEWLCLNCQTKRALGGTEQQRPPKHPAQSQEFKTEGSVPGSPKKKADDAQTKTGPEQMPKGEATPAKSAPVQQVQSSKQESSLFGFGLGGLRDRPRSPSPSPQPVESVSGKVLGLGSSIFSSASSLITSAVTDETPVTPPTARKESVSAQGSSKLPAAQKAEEKKAEDKKPQDTSKAKTLTEPPKKELQPMPPGIPSSCPLCKVELNVGSKDSPNYSTCTSCRNIVCNRCGFNPTPHLTEAKEWLCLNCQMQRASEPSMMRPEPSKLPTPSQADQQKKPTSLQTKGAKPSDGDKPKPVQESQQKKPAQLQEPQKPQVIPNAAPSPSKTAPPTEAEPPKQESGLFGFGLSGITNTVRSRSPSPQSAASVSGKVLGFGSSIFSTASNLMTSAAQEEVPITPPTSRKESLSAQASPKVRPAELNKPAVQKLEQKVTQDAHKPSTESHKKAGAPDAKPVLPSEKMHETLAKSKDVTDSTQPAPKGKSLCPLCKVELNMGSKDPPNYNTCTECKKTVCNLCGNNPMPHMTEVKEWLCLNCQTQRALGAMEPSGPPTSKTQPHTNKTQQKQTVSPAPISPKDKKKTDVQKPNNKPQTDIMQKTQETVKPQQSMLKADISKSAQPTKAEPSKQESGFFGFGFGGSKDIARSRSPSPKTAESVSGKVVGFGFSIFSSASNLITSSVQDEPPAEPPSSHKGSVQGQAVPKVPPESDGKPRTAQKPEDGNSTAKKVEQIEQPKTPLSKAKNETSAKAPQSSCPLCKVELNVGSKDPPNYNACTQCKNTVCNLCGFNPTPNLTDVKDWICLTCQMQRPLEGMEPSGPPVVTPQTTKVPTDLEPQKNASPTPVSEQRKDTPNVPAGQTTDSETPKTKVALAASTLKTKDPAPPSQDSLSQVQSPAPGSPILKEAPLPSLPGKKFTPSSPMKKDTIQSGSPQRRQSSSSPTPGSPQIKEAPHVGSPRRQSSPSVTATPGSPLTGSTHRRPSSPAVAIPASPLKKEVVESASPQRRLSSAGVLPTPGSPVMKGAVPGGYSPKRQSVSGTPGSPHTGSQNRRQSSPAVNPAPGSPKSKQVPAPGSPKLKEFPTTGSPKGKDASAPASPKLKGAPTTMPPSPKMKEFPTPTSPVRKEVPDSASQNRRQSIPTVAQKKIDVEMITSGKQDEQKLDETPRQPLASEVKDGVTTDNRQLETKQSSQRKSDQKSSDQLLKETSQNQPHVGASKTDVNQTAQEQAQKKDSGFLGFGFGTSKETKSQSLFGLGGLTNTPRSRSPSPQSVGAVSGKVMGFGSSIFSSASNLITSAVQDDPSSTPPSSRKGSLSTQATSKMPEVTQTKSAVVQKPLEKKTEESQDNKQSPPQTKEGPSVGSSQMFTKSEACPLCKVELNVSSKDPPNYNTCTECKKVVCNQCGFHTVPRTTEVKEWLCLNCQMQRALGGTEAPAPPMMKPQAQPSKASVSPSPEKDSQPHVSLNKKEVTGAAVSLQKAVVAQTPPEQPSVDASNLPTATTVHQVPSQNRPEMAEPEKPQVTKAEAIPAKSVPQPQAEPPKQDSGIFGFSFGGGKDTSKTQTAASKPAESVSGKLFGLAGLKDTARSRSPSPQPAESVSGKVMGFGSSFFSSASNLITSAVQDDPSSTPTSSRKASLSTQATNKVAETTQTKSVVVQKPLEKKPEESQENKQSPPQTKEGPSVGSSEMFTKSEACPLCKVELNVGSKDPPNYNTCTECKKIVCNQCGFHTVPRIAEVKEWLCLNCQMQRALGGTEAPAPPMMKPQAHPSKASVSPSPEKDSQPPISPHKKEVTGAADSLQKAVVAQKPPEQPPVDAANLQTATTVHQVPSQNRPEMAEPEKPQVTKAEAIPVKSVPQPQAEPPKQDSGIFGFSFSGGKDTFKTQPAASKPAESVSGKLFGLAGLKDTARSRSPSPQPAESVSGKVMGFGSSFFSSATNLIASTVQDDPSSTPPSSRKASLSTQATNKVPETTQIKSAVVQKPLEKKPEESQDNKQSPPQTKRDPSVGSSQMFTKSEACPLCKVDLNVGSKDPPNYNTCTECKKIVCNQCGFHTVPRIAEVKEWLCLNCQMQRALGGTEAPAPPIMKPEVQPSKLSVSPSPEKDSQPPVSPHKKEVTGAAVSLQKAVVAQKPPEQPSVDAADLPTARSVHQVPSQNRPEMAEPEKPQVTKAEAIPAKSVPQPQMEPPKQDSGIFGFSFGGGKDTSKTQPVASKPAESVSGKLFGLAGLKDTARSRSPSPQPAESVSGKVMGFGSSFFSSATNLIASTVQDDPSSTPPSSRKASLSTQATNKVPETTQTKSVVVQKPLEKKPEEPQDNKQSPPQTKEDPSVGSSQMFTKSEACPLCKVELNVGSKDPPNYNTCTECKKIVCNQCGFHTVPRIAEVKEWLCLNCQMQRALGGTEAPAPPMMKPQVQPSKVSVSPSPEKDLQPPVSPYKKEVAGAAVSLQKAVVAQKPPEQPSVDAANLQTATTVHQVPSQNRPEMAEPEKPQVTKAEAIPAKSVPQPQAEPPKQDSGIFGFSFGGGKDTSKTQPAASKPAESVSGKLFGLAGLKDTARSRSPSPQPAESVSGKVMGFGSSFFSSATNLIASTVQDDPSSTPPSSRKASLSTQATNKVPETTQTKSAVVQKPLEKKPEESQENKQSPPHTKEGPSVGSSEMFTKSEACPLCKVELNVGSKDPPNYNTCTECKKIVCNQCGFHTVPRIAEVKEWLCLNCQMQRALGGTEAPAPPMMKPEIQPSKLSVSPSPEKDSQPPVSPHKKEVTGAAFSSQKAVVAQKPPEQPPVDADNLPSATTLHQVPSHKRPDMSEPEKPQVTKAEAIPAKSVPQPQAEPPKQGSGIFGFSFGGGKDTSKTQPVASKPAESVSGKLFGLAGLKDTARSRSPSPQPAESVSGKVMGFGSSFFSSATNLITSTVQDEASVIPPTARKESISSNKVPTAEEIKPPPEHKEEKKPLTTAPSVLPKKNDSPPAISDVPVSIQAVQSSCPLCKTELNVGSKDPPNYKTCTGCKNIFCHLCGFNPVPHLTENEWLCLNCQNQRALSGQLEDMGKITAPAVTTTVEQQSTASSKMQPSPMKTPTSPKPAMAIKESEPVKSETLPPAPAPITPPIKAPVTAVEGPMLEKVADKMPIKAEINLKENVPQPAIEQKEGFIQPGQDNLTSKLDPKVEKDEKKSKIEASLLLEKIPSNGEGAAESGPTSEVLLSDTKEDHLNVTDLKDRKDKELRQDILRTSPESYSSAEEELRAIQKASEAADKYTETLKPQVVVARKQNYDSMEDSSESEPSPLLQRRKISSDSSSSGDYKANSPESVDDEEFIRRQLVEMGEDGEMDSATEKPKLLLKNLTIDLNASPKHSPSLEDLAEATHVIPLSQTVSREEMCVSNDNEIITTEGFNTADDSAHERVHGQKSTDECKVSMESLIDSPEEQSKGSSSVHVSSFTPGTASSTSVSSFDEDTDSSPSHKKKSLDSKHRKAKHRPHGQILPTIVDSSEEDDQHREEDNLKEQEKTREEQYSKKSSKKYKKDNDELRAQRKHEHPIQTSNISSIEDTSNTEDLEQAAEIDFISKTSGSELSKSIESETDEIAARPKPVLMIEETCSVPSISPYFPTESDRESQASEKPLKTADEAYEELMMKAETVKSMREKQRTPDIEPLYGGMTIEDYAYESLVEEPPFENQSRLHDTHVLDQSRISVLDYVQKLRKPEDVYEEMLQKREDLIPTEQQTLQDATPPVVPETCYVSILGSESMSYDELSRQQKEVLTPGTSPTQPSPISPASGSLSYDSPEVILIPSSSDEEDLKGEGKKDIDDSATRRDLYPIPDLKITQCSSNEEDQEEEEHEDVMPTDKGSTIDEQATTVNEPASTQSTEPISVICVMPPMPKVKPKVPPRPQIHAKPQIPQKPQLYSIPADPSKFGCGPEIVDQNSSMPAAPLHHVPVLFDPAIPTALETNATVVIPIPDTESLGPVESTASAVPPPFQHVPGTAAVLSTISVSIKSFPVTEVKVVKAQIAVSDPISAATPLHEPVIVKIPDVVSPLSIVPEPKLVETAKIPANPPCRIAEQTSHPAENSTLAATGKGPTVPFSVPGSVSRDQITTLPSLPVTIQMPDLVTSPVSTPDQELSTAVAVPASIINRSPDVSNARFSSIEPVQAAVPSPIPVPIQKAVISPLPEPSPVIVQMPDLVSSPSQVPICAFSSASVLASEITLIPNETRNQIPVVEPTPHPGPSPVLIEVVKPRLNLTAESAALPPQTGPSIPCPTLVADIQPPSRPPITVHTSSTISAVPPPPPPPPPPVPLTAYIPQAPTTTVAVVSPTIPAVSSTVASSAALRTLPCQPIQSVLADIQPRIEGVFPTSDAGPLNVSTITSSPQILPTLQTRQGHVVIILPRGSSFENISVINQAAQDVTNSVTVAATGSSVQASSQIPSVVPPLFSTPHVIPHSFSESVSTSIVPSTVTSTITTTTVASLVCHKQQSLTSIGSQETADVTAIPPPPIQPIFKAPPIKKPPVLSQETPTTGIKDSPKLEPSVTEMHTASSTLKHSTPPPVPPKPTCIPAGLKFSHKPGEIIRPPLSPQPTAAYRIPFDQPKAATLPRIREPPNVLSLSLTTPVESKLSATSPKSPLSPRFAKTLETYVVITLPSEPGTPVESITTQAPVRRASLPTSKIQTVSVSAVPPPKPIPQAEPLPTSPKDVAGIHSLTQETLCAPPLPPPRQEVTVPLPPLPVSIQIEPIVTLAAIPTLFQEVPSIVEMSALQNPVAPLPVSHLDQESIIPEPYSTRPVSLHSQEMSRLEQHVPVPECTETKSSVLQQQLPLETPAVLSGKQEPDISIGLALGSTSEPIPSVWVSEERQEIKMPTVAPFGIPQFAKSMESKDVYIPEIQEAIPGSGSPIAYTQFTQAVEGQQARGPENQQRATMPTGPVKITQFSKSIESQEIRGPEKVVSSVSQVFSAISTTGQQPETLPKVVTQVVTTEVQRTTTVSVVQERLQEEPVPESHNVAVTITPDIIPFKIQPEPKQNGRIHYPGDVIDLRTLKVNVTMTDKGMDLTAPESSRQSVSSDSSGRQSTAVQPEVVNLCNEIVPATTLSVVTDSITIVTCSATIASFKNTDKPLDLGSAMSTPLPLTTYKPFEPLAQIVYRPVNSQPMTRASTETPINLSHIAMESKTYTNVPVTIAPGILTSGSIYTPPLVPAYTDSFANDAVDLTTSKPVKAIVALSSAGPVTSIVEDDGTPVDLTAGRQTVCCDVIYNLPFARSCRTQPPSTSLPDNYFGFTEDQMNYQNATTSVITDLSNIKKSVSDNNFTQAELFYYEGKNGFSYQNGASDHAIDLTSSRMSTDACMCLRVLPQCFGFASC